MNQDSKTKWSYLAGMIDGEGCIAIWRTKSRAHDFAVSGKEYGSFNLRITITNTNLTLMKWLVSNFGGVYHIKRDWTNGWKNPMEWRPKGENNTQKMLLGVLPYLVIKREQAIIALKYIDLPRNCPKEREPLYQKLRELNRKGTTPETNTSNTFAEVKIESDLIGDNECAPVVKRAA